MNKSAIIVLTGIALVFLAIRCSSLEGITEGRIDYTINFPEFDAEEHTFLAILLPKQQVYTFKNNDFHSQVKKAMVEINIISNTEEKYFYSDIMFNEKQYFEGTIDQNNLKKFNIEFTDKTDTIAGFDVKQALAHSNELGTLELWYTEDIAMKNPNWHTPYYEVPGVLLEYTVIQNGVRMHFRVTAFEEEVIDDSLFTPAKKGSEIGFQAFQDQLTELFENFLKS